MAYSGFLIKVGEYTIPLSLIKAESYSAYVNMQDVDDYTDANGYLHREAVKLKAAKAEFETVPMMDNTTFSNLMANIRANFTIPKARQCMFTMYVPEYDDYVTQTGYLADFQPQMYLADDSIIKYNAIRLAFIGGVFDG